MSPVGSRVAKTMVSASSQVIPAGRFVKRQSSTTAPPLTATLLNSPVSLLEKAIHSLSGEMAASPTPEPGMAHPSRLSSARTKSCCRLPSVDV